MRRRVCKMEESYTWMITLVIILILAIIYTFIVMFD